MLDKPMNLGVIEGFYGRPWEPTARLEMMAWLGGLGFDAYLYAPKADGCLRKEWRRDWEPEQRGHLLEVSRHCALHGVQFWLGLSPFALYLDYDEASRQALRRKVQSLLDLGIDGLALLFDDMPGATDSLAARQAEICADVESSLGGVALSVCPTYYSDDAVLDRVFGQRPDGYLETLGRELSSQTGLFWTGPEVCSREISPEALANPCRALRRKVALWDNYPVNDSKLRSAHLYLQPLEGRGPELESCLSGHWCNAMNQPALSLPALASLPTLYGRPALANEGIFTQAGVTPEVLEALQPLCELNINELEAEHAQRLNRLSQSDTRAATELRGWLSGDYEFDPACLTD